MMALGGNAANPLIEIGRGRLRLEELIRPARNVPHTREIEGAGMRCNLLGTSPLPRL